MNKILFLFVISTLFGCAHNQPTQSEYDRHYVVVDVNINDQGKYNKFIELEAPVLKKYGAFMGMDIRSQDQKRRYLIISFPNREANENFVKSKEFQDILPLGIESAKSTIFHGYLHRSN